jgi:ketosteroid isomerase-like protein
MSQENVEIVQAGIAAWNQGDMHAFRELHHPDAILKSPEDWPEPGPFVGREAAMQQYEQLRQVWDADSVEAISDFIDAGDRVVVRYLWHTKGHGPDSSLEASFVATIRKGKIFLFEVFWDHAEALEAAGLSEPDAHADS